MGLTFSIAMDEVLSSVTSLNVFKALLCLNECIVFYACHVFSRRITLGRTIIRCKYLHKMIWNDSKLSHNVELENVVRVRIKSTLKVLSDFGLESQENIDERASKRRQNYNICTSRTNVVDMHKSVGFRLINSSNK